MNPDPDLKNLIKDLDQNRIHILEKKRKTKMDLLIKIKFQLIINDKKI